MKKLISFFVSIFLTTSIFSQVLYYNPTEQKTDSTDVIYHKGIPVVYSVKHNSLVIVTCQMNTKKSFWLHVFCRNLGTNRVNFFPENIKVTASNSCGTESPFKTYSAYEYLKKLKNTQDLGIVLDAIGNSLAVYQAGYSSSSTNSNVSGTIISSDGTVITGQGNGSSTTTTYDGSKAMEANAYYQQQHQQTVQQYYTNLYNANNQLLMSETLDPKEEVEGDVLVKINIENRPPQKLPKPSQLKSTSPNCIYDYDKVYVSIPVGNETHTFIFSK